MQILPGAGKPSPLHYLDTLRYVQQAGKNLQLSLVETALAALSARGLFISTSCRSEAEARELLKNTSDPLVGSDDHTEPGEAPPAPPV